MEDEKDEIKLDTSRDGRLWRLGKLGKLLGNLRRKKKKYKDLEGQEIFIPV